MRSYKKYDDSIKEMVIKSGVPNLFPELKIPRTTALYWIRHSKKKISLKEVGINIAYEKKIRELEKELESQRAINLFLSDMLKNLSGIKGLFGVRENREIIVDNILKFKKFISISKLCSLIGISDNKFWFF